MSLKIELRQLGDVAILDLEGRIVLGKAAGRLRDAIRDLLADGQTKIVLNLKDVDYIDSSGLAELVSSLTSTSGRGGNLRLLNLQKKVADVLRIARLAEVFEAYKDEGEALRSFQR